MRKTPIFTINLKKNCAVFYTFVFFSSLIFSVMLSNSKIGINTSGETIRKMVISSTLSAKKQSSLNTIFPLFSFEKAEEKNEMESAVSTKEIAPSKPLVQKTVAQNSDIKIANSTNIKIDTAALQSNVPSFLETDFSVLIIHTHTTESYTPSEKFPFTHTDTYRTRDNNYNMVRIGNKIEEVLTKNGIKVYHSEKTNDYPSYNQSYNKSLAEAEKMIKEHSDIKIILDVHRDAIETSGGEEIKYVSNINGSQAASLMLVVGSNLSGLEHDNWQDNMNFALNLQSHLNSLYPTLMRPLNFRSQRFNQHLAPGAIIVEVGTNRNTLEEALLGAEYFAEGLVSFVKNA
ncbi:MAG: stage II sporulation protein P [Clostridia bacterium]|nr:stage II sporulation protein P [Clostridia bacterium]